MSKSSAWRPDADVAYRVICDLTPEERDKLFARLEERHGPAELAGYCVVPIDILKHAMDAHTKLCQMLSESGRLLVSEGNTTVQQEKQLEALKETLSTKQDKRKPSPKTLSRDTELRRLFQAHKAKYNGKPRHKAFHKFLSDNHPKLLRVTDGSKMSMVTLRLIVTQNSD